MLEACSGYTLDEDRWNLARWAQESNKEDNLKAYHWFWYKGSNIPKMFEGDCLNCREMFARQSKAALYLADVVANTLTSSEKFNNSFQHADIRIFGRMAGGVYTCTLFKQVSLMMMKSENDVIEALLAVGGIKYVNE